MNEEKVRVEISISLKERLADIQKEIAETIKKKYGLKEVVIYGTIASQVLANGYKGKRPLNFKVRKIGFDKGIIELL